MDKRGPQDSGGQARLWERRGFSYTVREEKDVNRKEGKKEDILGRQPLVS